MSGQQPPAGGGRQASENTSRQGATAYDHPEWLSMDEGERVEWMGEPELVSRANALFAGVLLLPLLGLGLLVIIPTVLQVRNTDYVVTNQSLYAKRGVLSTTIKSLELDRIQNTSFDQSFVEKLLGYGTVGVSTAGSDGTEMSFEAIGDAEEVRDLVRELSKRYTGATTDEAGATASPSSELAEELRRTREALESVDAAIGEVLAQQRGASGSSGQQRGRDNRGASDPQGSARGSDERGAGRGDADSRDTRGSGDRRESQGDGGRRDKEGGGDRRDQQGGGDRRDPQGDGGGRDAQGDGDGRDAGRGRDDREPQA